MPALSLRQAGAMCRWSRREIIVHSRSHEEKTRSIREFLLMQEWKMLNIVNGGLWKLAVETVFFYYFQNGLTLSHQKALASAIFIYRK